MGDEMELLEMREDVARDLYDASDYSMTFCRMEIERMSDGEVFALWEKITARA